MPRGRPLKDQVRVTFYLPRDLFTQLSFYHPELFLPQFPLKFSHGSATKYFTGLLVRDLQKLSAASPKTLNLQTTLPQETPTND